MKELHNLIGLWALLASVPEKAVSVDALLKHVDLKEYRIRKLLNGYPQHFAHTGKSKGRGASKPKWYRGTEEPRIGTAGP